MTILISVGSIFDKKKRNNTPDQFIFKPMFMKFKWMILLRFSLKVFEWYKIHLRPSLVDINCFVENFVDLETSVSGQACREHFPKLSLGDNKFDVK